MSHHAVLFISSVCSVQRCSAVGDRHHVRFSVKIVRGDTRTSRKCGMYTKLPYRIESFNFAVSFCSPITVGADAPHQ